MEGVLKPEENEKLEKSSERLVLKEGQGVEERGIPRLELATIYPDDPSFEEAIRLEFQVFDEAGYLDATSKQIQEVSGYSDYNPSSCFDVVSEGGKLVGVLREIRPSTVGFKTLNDFSVAPYVLYPEAVKLLANLDKNTILEIGTVSVVSDKRQSEAGFGVALRLYGAMLHNSLSGGYTHWLASIDSGLLGVYKENFGFCFEDIGPSQDYMGSPTTPVLGDRDKILDNLRENFPFMVQTIIEGKFSDEQVDYGALAP